jgi:hypothetical protein
MKMELDLPENTKLTPEKIQDLDTLLSLFDHNELKSFYNQKQHTMHITTKKEVEIKNAIENLLTIIN